MAERFDGDDREDRERAFDPIVHEYYRSIESGESIDRQAFIEKHSEFKDELKSFFADLDELGQVAVEREPRRSDRLDPTLPSASDGAASQRRNGGAVLPGGSVRYIGEYRVLEEIDRGGMGIVYKARQEKLRRTVALKMILLGRAATTADVERFTREARAAATLKHPNIVGVHEIGTHEGHHFYAMDFIESESLTTRLREGSFAPRDAARIVATLATATHFAHDMGVLHRDLKPGNVLIDRDGKPHIADFGLAKLIGEAGPDTIDGLTQSGQILGTPSYMSPEQAAAKHQLVSIASDTYSLGAILYACLGGRAPFVAESPVETLRQVIENEPVPLRSLNPKIPRDLENICHKCLQKEPHRRYGTAQELADDLNRYLDGRPVSARPVSTTTKLYRWTKRNPAVSSLIALVFLLLISGTGVSSYFAIVAEQRATAETNARRYAEEQEQKVSAALDGTQKALARESASLRKAEEQRARAEQAEARATREQKAALAAQRQAETERERAEAEKKRAQWHTYVAQLQPMRQAWLEKEFGHLERLLAESTPGEGQPDFRGWEWYYFQDQVNQASERVGKLKNFFGFFTYDPVHHRVLIGKTNDEWELWSLRSNSLLEKYKFEGCKYESIRFSPDGDFVAWGTSDLRVLVMDLESRRIVHEIDAFPEERKFKVDKGPQNAVAAVAWHPSGKQLVASTLLGGIKIWDLETGALLRELQRGLSNSRGSSRATLSLDWHQDGGIAAAIRWGTVRVFDPESGRERWSKRYGSMYPSAVEWNDAGSRLLHGGQGIVVYDHEGTELANFPHVGGATRATWIDDQELVCGGSNQDVEVFNVLDKERTSEFHIHQGRVEALAVVGGDTILSGSADGTLRRIPLNDSNNLALRIAAHSSETIYGPSWRGDGKVIGTAGGGDNATCVWDAESGDLIARLDGEGVAGTDIEWNLAGSKLVTLHATNVRFWDPNTYELLGSRDIPGTHRLNGYRQIEWTNEDRQFTIAGSRRVSVFDSESLELLFHLTPSSSYRPWYSYSPDQTRICAVTGSKLFVADTKSGKTLFEARKPSSLSSGYGVDWSPDGRVFAVGGGAIFLYNSSTYNRVATLSGHRSEVFCVEYDPSGRRIASVGGDGNLNLWDAASGDLLLRIPHEGEQGLEHLEWSPDGRRIAVTTKTGNLWIWGSPEMPKVPAEIDFIDGDVLKSVQTPEEQLEELVKKADLDPKDLTVRLGIINLAERTEKWEFALRQINEYVELMPADRWRPSRGLQLAGWLNDSEGMSKYSDMCEETLNRDAGALAKSHAALSLLLVPDHVKDFDRLVRLTSEHSKESSGWHHAFAHLVALYRVGAYDKLQNELAPYRETQDSPARVFVCLFDAIVSKTNGQDEAAVNMLRDAEAILRRPFYNKLAALLLHREIREIVEDKASSDNVTKKPEPTD